MKGSKKLSEKQKAALERLRERALKPPVKEEKKEEEGLLGLFGEAFGALLGGEIDENRRKSELFGMSEL